MFGVLQLNCISQYMAIYTIRIAIRHVSYRDTYGIARFLTVHCPMWEVGHREVEESIGKYIWHERHIFSSFIKYIKKYIVKFSQKKKRKEIWGPDQLIGVSVNFGPQRQLQRFDRWLEDGGRWALSRDHHCSTLSLSLPRFPLQSPAVLTVLWRTSTVNWQKSGKTHQSPPLPRQPPPRSLLRHRNNC